MVAKVVDASVLAAIAFQESEAERAASLLGEVDVHAPTILEYELASVARTKAIRYPERRDELLLMLDRMLNSDIRWSRVDQVVAVSLALRVGLSTYDASYLYVARALGLALVTFDARLQAAHERLNRESRAPDEPNERRPRP